MSMTSIGDLAQSLMLRTRSTHLKQTMMQLTEELSTGQVTDVSERLGNDYAHISDINRNLTRLDGYSIATTEATLFTASAQTGLGRLYDLSSDLGTTLIAIGDGSLETARENAAYQAETALESAISALNSQVAGRSVFGGTLTDQPPMASAEDLLDALRTEMTGLNAASDIRQAAEDWFADPAGYVATMYSGADQSLAPFRLGAGEEVSMTLRADDEAFGDVLKNLALAALTGDDTLGLSIDVRNAVLSSSGESLFSSSATLSRLSADLGYAEARIEEAAARNEAARSSLEFARTKLLEADPYETASRLEEVQFQLESLYSVTVRTSRLSLLSYLE